MDELKNFRPRTLQKTENGDLFLPLNFNNYGELGALFCQLSTSLHIISKMAQESNSVPTDDVGHGIEGITKVLHAMAWGMYDDLKLLDNLQELNNE